jgi:hypothetical protein
MSCLLALFYRRGDLHLLGKIEMKIFIYMQALMLIIHPFYPMHISYSYICIIQDRRRSHQ